MLLCPSFFLRSGTPAAFAYDDVAVKATLDAIAAGADAGLTAAEKLFLFTPLMHSESAAHQAESVKQFAALADAHGAARRGACAQQRWHLGCLPRDNACPTLARVRACAPLLTASHLTRALRCLRCRCVPAADIGTLRYALGMANDHADVVTKFGHFPHRNAANGRVTTPEEEAWLAGPIPGWAKSQTAAKV